MVDLEAQKIGQSPRLAEERLAVLPEGLRSFIEGCLSSVLGNNDYNLRRILSTRVFAAA